MMDLTKKRYQNMKLLKAQQGFTLIELMIVVVIIAILAGVALPNYQDYVRRSHIADAKQALVAHRVAYEQFFLDNRGYPTSGVCLATDSHAPDAFNIACVSDPTTYTITATGTGIVANFNYTLTQANVRGSTTPWGNNATCWVSAGNGGC